MKLTERQKDILLAGAIGDAVGYLVEFHKVERIWEEYGPQGLHIKQVQPGATLTVSDDTQMTLFTLEALRYLPYDPQPRDIEYGFFKSFMQWMYTQYNPGEKEITSPVGFFESMRVQRAPGATCLSALSKNWSDRPAKINDSKGCGGIMRAAPCGFLATQESAVAYGHWQAKVTHGHPSGHLSAAYFAGLIWALDNGLTLEDAITSCDTLVGKFKDATETLDIVYRAVLTAKRSTGDYLSDVKYLGEGWVGEEALAIAVYSVLVAKSFEQALSISINHNGDSDSTGSLAAQLWVALHGLPAEYKDWDKQLDIADAFAIAMDEKNYEQV